MSSRHTRILVFLTAGSLFLATTVAVQPINATSYRLAFLVSALGAWLGLLPHLLEEDCGAGGAGRVRGAHRADAHASRASH